MANFDYIWIGAPAKALFYYLRWCGIDKTSNISYDYRHLEGTKMDKTKASRSKNKPVIKLKKGTGIRKSNPTEELLDEELIGRAIW